MNHLRSSLGAEKARSKPSRQQSLSLDDAQLQCAKLHALGITERVKKA